MTEAGIIGTLVQLPPSVAITLVAFLAFREILVMVRVHVVRKAERERLQLLEARHADTT